MAEFDKPRLPFGETPKKKIIFSKPHLFVYSRGKRFHVSLLLLQLIAIWNESVHIIFNGYYSARSMAIFTNL